MTSLQRLTYTGVVTVQELAQQMRRWGMRVTAQRLAVAEVLVDSRDHPTAHEVYERVQLRFPHITMGTVYNTVRTLAERGLVQLLVFPAGTRYDGNPLPHANLVCVHCGTIVDAADEHGWVARLREDVVAKSSFRVMSQRLDLYGLCAACADQKAS